MRSFFLLCILVGAVNLVKSTDLKCNFTSQVDYACGCDLYGCFASYIDGNAITYDSTSGVHEAGKTISDVKHLGIRYSTFNFMPPRLDRLFNLSSLLIQLSSMSKIVKDDFIGLENLEYLHLSDNLISYLPSDVFWRIPHLKKLTLRGNQIEELPKNLFQYNLQLDGLWIEKNKIKYVNPTIFDRLPKLYYAEFLGEHHKCLTKYYSGPEEIATLKQDVKKCANPNEVAISNDDILGVLDICEINKDVFVQIVKSVQSAHSAVSIPESFNTSPSSLYSSIEIKKNCRKFSTFFSLF